MDVEKRGPQAAASRMVYNDRRQVGIGISITCTRGSSTGTGHIL